MAQYQDTIARLLLEEADEAVTRVALDEMMPVAPAARSSVILHEVLLRGIVCV